MILGLGRVESRINDRFRIPQLNGMPFTLATKGPYGHDEERKGGRMRKGRKGRKEGTGREGKGREGEKEGKRGEE